MRAHLGRDVPGGPSQWMKRSGVLNYGEAASKPAFGADQRADEEWTPTTAMVA